MLGSQLRETESLEEVPPLGVPHSRPTSQGNGSTVQAGIGPNTSTQRVKRTSLPTPRSAGEQSDHTRIWSELSGSETKSLDHREAAKGPVQMQDSNDGSEEILVALQRRQSNESNVNQIISGRVAYPTPASSDLMRGDPNYLPHLIGRQGLPGEDVSRLSVDHGNVSRRNPSNWLSSDTDEDEGEGDDLFVESTPPQRRGIV